MGTNLERRDLYLNPVPSGVGKDDIKRALAKHGIGTRKVIILERTSNSTRYAFVTPHSNIDYIQMKEIGVILVDGSAIKISEAIVKSKENEDSHHNARISALLRDACSLGIDLQEILSLPPCTRPERHKYLKKSCHTFHAVHKNSAEVRLARSLIVDPTTNKTKNPCRLTRSPLADAPYDDIKQEETDLSSISDFYCTPERMSSNFQQTFDKIITSTLDPPAENQEASLPDTELGSSNSMFKSLHLERTQRRNLGSVSRNKHKADSLGREKSVSEPSSLCHRTCSSSDSSSDSSIESSFTVQTVQSVIFEHSASKYNAQNFSSGLNPPALSPLLDNSQAVAYDEENTRESNNFRDPKKTLLLEENIALLTFFREELKQMINIEDFEDFEGTEFQAVHIFGHLIDGKHLSQAVVDRNSDVILKIIDNSENKVSTMTGLVEEIEDEDPDDEMLDELKEQKVEAEMILKKQKADFLILQIDNAINHIGAITNSGN